MRYVHVIFSKAWSIMAHPLAAFLIVFTLLLNIRYPHIGHDFRLFFPFLLEGKWHVFHNGFWPLRFAVHLCGGFPLYGNPNDAFYSLTQILVLFIPPWIAVQLTAAFMLIAGYAGWMLFGRDVLLLQRGWQRVFAFIVTANGFYFSHVLVGHINFLSFPLIGILLWIIFDKKDQFDLSVLHRSVFFALISAVIMYSGGYYTMIHFTVLAAILVMVGIFFIGVDDRLTLRGFAVRSVACGIASFCISLSKIVAVTELLNGMPYSVYVPRMSEGQNAFLYVVRALWALPQSNAHFNGIPWSLHEKTMHLSPVVLVGLIAGIVLLFMRGRSKLMFIQRLSIFLFSVLLLVVFMEISHAGGPLAKAFFSLPIFSSFRVSTRFLFIFALWLSMVSVSSLARLASAMPPRFEALCVRASLMVTLCAFLVAYAPIMSQFDLSMNDKTRTVELVESLRKGWDKPVEEVRSANYSFDGTTNIMCRYESVFLGGHNPQKNWLREGPVTDVKNGYFNLANPSCYQYGAENGCVPGQAIHVTDKENFENFRNGKPVSWRLSVRQYISDAISMIALVFCVSIASLWALKRANLLNVA